MSRYTLREFHEAGIEPSECDRIISDDLGADTLFMACSYHEGYIDGSQVKGQE